MRPALQIVALLASLVASVPAAPAEEAPCPGIRVRILDIRNSAGTVACALFESPGGFPVEFLHSATNVVIMKVRRSQARCDFADIPPGNYAIAVVHDENMNGKLDTGLMGVPKEGYGFSNDARALFGAPTFAAAAMKYDGRNLELTIKMRY